MDAGFRAEDPTVITHHWYVDKLWVSVLLCIYCTKKFSGQG